MPLFNSLFGSKKSNSGKVVYILGLPAYRRVNFEGGKAFYSFGIQLFKRIKTPKTTRYTLLGIPLYAKKKRGARTIRRVLFIRWSKFNWHLHVETLQKKHTQQILTFERTIERLSSSMTSLKNELSAVRKEQREVLNRAAGGQRSAAEAVWALTFNSVSCDSDWLIKKNFSAGRWAVGYPALYIMFRVLNEARPKRILELGLGQSTRMIGQYVAAHEDVEHIVVEHDPSWIEFCKNDFALTERTQMLQCDRIMEPYKEADEVRVFEGLSEKLAGKKFDFIVIDAPLGGDMKHYSRIDVLKMLPDCLEERFVILLDDTNRPGEIATLKEMKSKLEKNSIDFASGDYRGDKSTSILCSSDISFFTSL